MKTKNKFVFYFRNPTNRVRFPTKAKKEEFKKKLGFLQRWDFFKEIVKEKMNKEEIQKN